MCEYEGAHCQYSARYDSNIDPIRSDHTKVIVSRDLGIASCLNGRYGQMSTDLGLVRIVAAIVHNEGSVGTTNRTRQPF